MIASILGAYGVFNDIDSLIVFFTFAIFFILAAQVMASVNAVNIRSSLAERTEARLWEGLQNHINGVDDAFNDLHQHFKCCGFNNSTDWDIPPASCCMDIESCDPDEPEDLFSVGCAI